MLETACHNIAHWYVCRSGLFPISINQILSAEERCSPSPGLTIELGFLGSVLHVELPMNADIQQLTETASFHEKFDPTLHVNKLSLALDLRWLNRPYQLLSSIAPLDPPPISIFEASLPHLWSIWECLMLCEPILVFGSSPAATSQAVWWLRDLLRPVRRLFSIC